MIYRDRHSTGEKKDPAHPNTPGARKEDKAPDANDDTPIADVPSPQVGEELNDVDDPAPKATPTEGGTADEPVAADRVTNKRSKKYRA